MVEGESHQAKKTEEEREESMNFVQIIHSQPAQVFFLLGFVWAFFMTIRNIKERQDHINFIESLPCGISLAAFLQSIGVIG